MRRLSFVLVAPFLAVPHAPRVRRGLSTPETAVTARIQAAPLAAGGPAPYLGIHVQPDATGRLVIDDVQPESPAEKAGLKAGNALARVDGKEVSSPDAFKDALRSKARAPTSS